MQVCGDGRAIRPGPKQRTTPHPALRATFPSKLGKGSARGSKTIFSARLPRSCHVMRQAGRDDAGNAGHRTTSHDGTKKVKAGVSP